MFSLEDYKPRVQVQRKNLSSDDRDSSYEICFMFQYVFVLCQLLLGVNCTSI